jgi:outer membrane protein assembly factor BamB/ABC-type phosphate/phosphonate transport system substrate-binding protein
MRLAVIVSVLIAWAPVVVANSDDDASIADASLTLVIMDPLAAELSCPCVEGYAQRDYRALTDHLTTALGRTVNLGFGESLAKGRAAAGGGPIDIVIGKHSVVRADAAAADLPLEPVASLSDVRGTVFQRGLFVVAADDPAESLADLAGYRFVLGTPAHEEKHDAALCALRRYDLHPGADDVTWAPSCSEAACQVLDAWQDGDASQPLAAVISSYAQPLLEGCGSIPEGAIRVVGETAQVPFISVHVSPTLGPATRTRLIHALAAVGRDPTLCNKLETARGFVAPSGAMNAAWPGWLGPSRNGRVAWLPDSLPKERKTIWEHALARPGLGGVAVANGLVVFGDRDAADELDEFHCLDADTGRLLWTVSYAAPGTLDYGTTPRSTPLFFGETVILCGAFGHVHCVAAATGDVLWKRSLREDFAVADDRVSAWGYCGSPLIDAGHLLLAPGAAEASVVAVDPASGNVIWQSPGAPYGHGSFIAATLGGRRQFVGHDQTSLGGWDVATGERLWSLVPTAPGDFNVPTPMLAGADRLLVASENNGTRLYGFDEDGRIAPQPLATSAAFEPEMSTPLGVAGRIYGVEHGLVCLECPLDDSADGLAPVGERLTDPLLGGYAACFATSRRLLVVGNGGTLLLFNITGGRPILSGTLRLFDDGPDEPLYSSAALCGTRLFIRGPQGLACVELGDR